MHEARDYATFLEMMAEATLRGSVRNVADRLMPDHARLALWPRADGDLGRGIHSSQSRAATISESSSATSSVTPCGPTC